VPREEHLEDLMELVSSHYWRALKHEIAIVERGLIARLCQPITSIPELVVKEGHASRLAALRDLVSDIEEKAERHAQQSVRD
jgi:hypothetical protein